MLKRLLVALDSGLPKGYSGFRAGYLDADDEIRRGKRVRLVDPREPVALEDLYENAPCEANLSLMEGICLSVGGLDTTLGMPQADESVDDADTRVLLDVTEARLHTVALESRQRVPRIRFIRAMGNVGTPVALAFECSIDVAKAFPATSPGYTP